MFYFFILRMSSSPDKRKKKKSSSKKKNEEEEGEVVETEPEVVKKKKTTKEDSKSGEKRKNEGILPCPCIQCLWRYNNCNCYKRQFIQNENYEMNPNDYIIVDPIELMNSEITFTYL